MYFTAYKHVQHTGTNGGGIGSDIIVHVIPLADAVFCLLPTQAVQKRQREWGGGGGELHAWNVNTSVYIAIFTTRAYA